MPSPKNIICAATFPPRLRKERLTLQPPKFVPANLRPQKVPQSPPSDSRPPRIEPPNFAPKILLPAKKMVSSWIPRICCKSQIDEKYCPTSENMDMVGTNDRMPQEDSSSHQLTASGSLLQHCIPASFRLAIKSYHQLALA